MVSPTRRLRSVMSEGLTSPMIVASTNTDHGAARPLRNNAASAAATAR